MKMFRHVIIFAVMVICIGCVSTSTLKTKVIEKTLAGGTKVVFEGYYKDGKAVEHGKCVASFENGLRCEMHYEHGSAEGKCTWFYPDGTKAFEGTYRKNSPWDGIAMTLGMCNGEPHQYRSGKDCGAWKDTKGFFNDE